MPSRNRTALLGGAALVGVLGLAGAGWWAAGDQVVRMVTRRTKLSPNFRAGELVVSRKADELGLDNWPKDPVIFDRLAWVANDGLEPIRAFHGSGLAVSSGYRTPEVNAAVGGSATSDHMSGFAVDFVPVQGSSEDLFHRLRTSPLFHELAIDQLIYYPARGHIHLGMRRKNARHEAGISREGERVQWLS